jgi:hypothetical protein
LEPVDQVRADVSGDPLLLRILPPPVSYQVFVKADDVERCWTLGLGQKWADFDTLAKNVPKWEDWSASFAGHSWEPERPPPAKVQTVFPTGVCVEERLK